MISPSEYWDAYPEELKEEITGNERIRMWLDNVNTFKTLIRVCPFPISKEAEEWINLALLDI